MSLAPVTVPLSAPIAAGGTTVQALTIREAKLSDLIAMEDFKGSPLTRFAALLSRLTGVAPEALHELTASDLKRIQVEAGVHLGNEEEDGATSPS